MDSKFIISVLIPAIFVVWMWIGLFQPVKNIKRFWNDENS